MLISCRECSKARVLQRKASSGRMLQRRHIRDKEFWQKVESRSEALHRGLVNEQNIEVIDNVYIGPECSSNGGAARKKCR